MATSQASGDDEAAQPGRRLPIAVFLVVGLGSLLAWSLFNVQQRQLESELFEQRLQGITVAMGDQLHIRGAALERLAARQAAALDESERRRMFAVDAPRYLQDFPTLSAIYWISPDQVVVQRESLRPGDLPGPALGPQLEATLLRARTNGDVVLSPTIEVAGVGPSMLLVAAGLRDRELRGYVLALQDHEETIPASLASLAAGSPMVVRRGGDVLFATGARGRGTPRTQVLERYGERLAVELWPSATGSWTRRLDDALLLAGLLGGLLLAVALRLSVVARQRARSVAATEAHLRETAREAESARLALERAQQEMGTVFESISDAFVTLDRSWRFTAVNSRGEQLMQRKAADILGLDLWSVFPEAKGTVIEQQYRMAMDLRQPAGFEVHFAPLAVWFSVRAYPSDQGMSVYFQDITERKAQEQAMLRAQAASDRAQRLARLGSCEHDLATGQVMLSEEARRIFGVAPSQLARGLPALIERVHFDDRARLEEGYRRLHAGEADLDIEYRITTADGDIRVVRELGTLARDADGVPTVASLALQDITERQRAEQAQRELTRRLEQSLSMRRLVMDNSLDVICVLDANGRFAQVSEASRRTWGRAPNDMLGRPLADFTHADDREASVRMLAATVDGEPVHDFRCRFTCSDGRVVTMQLSVAWAPAERLLFAVARDVTQADAQSRALVETRDSLERAQRVALMGSWELRLDGEHLHWSAQVFDIFQVEPDEFTGNFEAFAMRVHPDDLPALQAAQARVLAGEGDLDLRHRIVSRDGAIGYVHERARLVCDDDGVPRLLAGTVQDITAQVLAQLELEKERGFLLAMLESLSEAILACDAEGNVTLSNRAMREVHGLPMEPFPPGRMAEYFSLFRADGVTPLAREDAPLARALRGESVHGVELVVVARGKPPRVVLCSGQPIVNAAGHSLGAVVAMRDITQLKRARELEDGQRQVLAGIAARRPLNESLEALTRLFESQYPDSLCSVMLLDKAGERLLAAAAPSLPPAYVLALHGQPIGPKVGSCGTAAYRRERVVCADITTDPLWEEFAEAATGHGLRACWSTPVLASDGRVLATFANYFRAVRSPTEDEVAVVDGLSSLAAVAIEHANAYRAIDLNEQRFRSLFDEHPDAVYSMDLDGRFTSYNGRFKVLARHGKGELLGSMFDDSVAPEHRDVARGHFHAAARGEARTYELTAMYDDQRRVDVRVTNLPIVVDGRVTGVFGIAQNITLLRKHQRELAQALDAAEAGSLQLRRLSESAVTLNRSIGAQDMYQQLADKLRETLGAHHALVSLGRGEAQQVQGVSVSAKYARWKTFDASAGGNGIHRQVCVTNRPLRLNQAELEAQPGWPGVGVDSQAHPPMRGCLLVPLIASSGQNIGLLQLSDKVRGDFTGDDELVAVQFAQMASIAIERAELIEKLRERNRFFDMSLEVFVIFNPQSMRWQQVNPVFAELLGYSAEELCAREFFDFMHPDDHAATRERARLQAANLPVPRMFENRFVGKDGTVRWLEWMSERGEDGLVFGVGRDITQRRQAELALRQTLADLDARNRELQDFAFVASHDLQEPLRKIRAFSDRLQQRYSEGMPAEARDYLSRSSQAAARMQTLIDDLLAYSRVAARGKPFGKVDMGALVAAVSEDLEARLESSGGRIEAGPLPTIEGDPTQLRQMMQNLLANALKFRHPARPPVVSVSAEPTRIDGVAAWCFRVVDNGIGFDMRYADKVFVPFQRLHGRQEYEGTGIGLAIVRRIVERHRGTVVAEGVAGEGATFTVCLPERQPAPETTSSGLLSR